MGKTMRKLALLSLSMLFLTGCAEEQAPEFGTGASNPAPLSESAEADTEPSHELQTVGYVGRYDVVQDNKTGCLYLEYKGAYPNLTPYYDGKGNVAGCFASNGESESAESQETAVSIGEES